MLLPLSRHHEPTRITTSSTLYSIANRASRHRVGHRRRNDILLTSGLPNPPIGSAPWISLAPHAQRPRHLRQPGPAFDWLAIPNSTAGVRH